MVDGSCETDENAGTSSTGIGMAAAEVGEPNVRPAAPAINTLAAPGVDHTTPSAPFVTRSPR